jgi:hypothetical protein
LGSSAQYPDALSRPRFPASTLSGWRPVPRHTHAQSHPNDLRLQHQVTTPMSTQTYSETGPPCTVRPADSMRERHTEIPHTANQGSPPSPAPTDASVRAHTHNANTGTRKRARAQTQSHRASRSVTAPRRNISVDVSRTATTQDTGLRTVNMEDHEGCIIRDQATNFPDPATRGDAEYAPIFVM